MQKKKSVIGRIVAGVIALILVLAVFLYVYAFVTFRNMNVSRLEDYLYYADAPHVNDSLSRLLLSVVNVNTEGACSAVRNGNLFGRNFDWYYCSDAEFVVRTQSGDGRYATIGVASVVELENDDVAAGKFSPYYMFLSLYIVDGMNEKGLAISTHSVPAGDVGTTTGTNPGHDRLCSSIIPRIVLDYAANVDEAIELLSNYDVYSYVDNGIPFEVHFLLSDSERSVAVEFIDNEMVVTENVNILTNFYVGLDGYTEHSQGIERYDILQANFDSSSTPEGMAALLNSVRYSQIYDSTLDPFWKSESYGEFVADDGEVFGLSSDIEKFMPFFQSEKELSERSERDTGLWITSHSSIYDTDRLTLTVTAQENGIPFYFDLHSSD